MKNDDISEACREGRHGDCPVFLDATGKKICKHEVHKCQLKSNLQGTFRTLSAAELKVRRKEREEAEDEAA